MTAGASFPGPTGGWDLYWLGEIYTHLRTTNNTRQRCGYICSRRCLVPLSFSTVEYKINVALHATFIYVCSAYPFEHRDGDQKKRRIERLRSGGYCVKHFSVRQ